MSARDLLALLGQPCVVARPVGLHDGELVDARIDRGTLYCTVRMETISPSGERVTGEHDFPGPMVLFPPLPGESVWRTTGDLMRAARPPVPVADS